MSLTTEKFAKDFDEERYFKHNLQRGTNFQFSAEIRQRHETSNERLFQEQIMTYLIVINRTRDLNQEMKEKTHLNSCILFVVVVAQSYEIINVVTRVFKILAFLLLLHVNRTPA